ncbi:MAG TPA: T9SS type A sorting domain-containing protein, partial [Puia sp.]
PEQGANYYRLKMVAKDGHFTYSNIVIVSFSLAVIEIYPNPAQKIIYLKNNANFTNNEQMEVALVSPLGQRLSTQTVSTAGQSIITVHLPSGIANGVYFLKATNSKGDKQTWKIQIQN